MALWRQITPCGVTSGGRLSNQFAEQIDGPASGDTSHVKGPGLLLMSQDVELRSPFARVRHGSAWKEWGRPIRELRQDDPDEAGRDSCARPFVDPW